MKLKLPDSVASPQDLISLQLEVQEYAQWFAHAAIKKKVASKDIEGAPVMSPATTEILRAYVTDKASLDELAGALKAYGATAPVISITLAAPPSQGLKAMIVGWCRQNITPNALVTFQFNATLLGGMVIRSGSHIFDWSFRRQILDARAKFPEVLRRV